MRGRKPTPTAIKEFNGNPGHRPLNHNEPQHDPLDITCPAQITDPVARQEWDDLAPRLVERGQLTVVDRGILILYCEYFAQWQRLKAAAAEHPDVVKAPSGYPMPNPLIGMANKAATLCRQMATELGITPSSRSRVVAVRQEREGDPFAAHQAKRPQLSRVK